MSSFSKEMVFLIHQFLDDEKFKETLHTLEQESGYYFNLKYFEEEVLNGNWDNVDRYLSGFTKINDNGYSTKIFFEIRKQKYLEALDIHDRPKAIEILVKDLKVFASFNEEVFKDLAHLLTLENLRENEQLSKYGDIKSVRTGVLVDLKKLIEENPLFRDKLQFPHLQDSRLHTLMKHSFNWQHKICKHPRPNPDMKTLYKDHNCGKPNGSLAPVQASNNQVGRLPNAGGCSQSGGKGNIQHAPAPAPASLASWIHNPPAIPHSAISGGAIGRALTNPATILKHPRIPSSTNPAVEYPSADFDMLKRRPIGISDEVNLPVNISPVSFPQNRSQPTYVPDELPKTFARTLNQGSTPMSMDFHPVFETILLVGTNVGDIGLWDIGSGERLVHRNFKVWELGTCSVGLKAVLMSGSGVSVNRVTWNPDGSLFGVAFSRNIVQLYSYHGADAVSQHLELDAHVGSVNDLAFRQHKKKLFVITCGDDKMIKVWDAKRGTKQYTFEGHEAAVYSVCPHYKENVQFILSTALDGKIKAWLYDNVGSRVDYDAPGCWCTMAYSADGSRLFSCGTSKEGESFIVEWNESEGEIKRKYQGFSKRPLNVVQFDTTRNRFLASGDEYVIKVWDMDNVNVLTTIDAEGGLPERPLIRFNKDGTFLAVSTSENGIKILANAEGLSLLRTFENHIFDTSRTAPDAVPKPLVSSLTAGATSSGVLGRVTSAVATTRMNEDSRNIVNVKPIKTEESGDKSMRWKETEINEASQCRSLRLMDNSRTSKISRLIYTNSGAAILALASNAIHLLWKWPRNEQNTTRRATTCVAPQLWQPPSGILMTNDTPNKNSNPEEAISCFALSSNDSYVMSASGGKISLFNMMTFKTLTAFMPPPPAATFLAFHPQDNNIVAIGMEDSVIQIYDVRTDEVKGMLRGHSKRITGLAFSHFLNVLISSGADAQLCVWGINGWEKQRNILLQIPLGRTLSDPRVRFHQDQIHFLAVHGSQISIYDANNLECVKQWIPDEGSPPISDATFSCDSQLVYACFLDATVCAFSTGNLRLLCRINPAAYLPANVSRNVCPTVIAAHPSEPYQFAVGMTDGSIHVLEPMEAGGKWGMIPPDENGSASSLSVAAPAGSLSSDQPQKM